MRKMHSHPPASWYTWRMLTMTLACTECTTGVPYTLQLFGVANMCADMTLEGCSEVVRVGLRFEGQEEALVEREISAAAGHQSACIAAADLAGSDFGAIDAACGDGWQLCFSIGRMRIGANFLAGCPKIEVRDDRKRVLLNRACPSILFSMRIHACSIPQHLTRVLGR